MIGGDVPRFPLAVTDMTNKMLTVAAVLLMALPAAHAQGASTTTPASSRREQAMERRENAAARRSATADRRAAMTPEQRDASRARRAARVDARPEAQTEYRTDMQAYRTDLRTKAAELRAQMKAGTITANDMAVQLRVFRSANRPANPAAATRRSRTP